MRFVHELILILLLFGFDCLESEESDENDEDRNTEDDVIGVPLLDDDEEKDPPDDRLVKRSLWNRRWYRQALKTSTERMRNESYIRPLSSSSTTEETNRTLGKLSSSGIEISNDSSPSSLSSSTTTTSTANSSTTAIPPHSRKHVNTPKVTRNPTRYQSTTQTIEEQKSSIGIWVLVATIIVLVTLVLVGLFLCFVCRPRRKDKVEVRGSKDKIEGRKRRKHRKGRKKGSRKTDERNHVYPGTIDPETFHIRGRLKMEDHKLPDGPLRHALENDKSTSLHEVIYDNEQNEVFQIGTDIEILEMSHSRSATSVNSNSKTPNVKQN